MSYGVWLFFVLVRRQVIEGDPKLDSQQFINAGVISLYWLLLYSIAGLYRKPYRRSRLWEFSQVLTFTIGGVLVIFFSIFLNDPVPNYQVYRMTITTYFTLQFLSVAIVRLIHTSYTNRRIQKRMIGYPTLLVGCGAQALSIYEELNGMRRSLGYMFKGFVSLPDSSENVFYGRLKRFGTIDRIPEIIRSRKIEEVIIALEADESDKIGEIIDLCAQLNVNIKILPGMYDYIVGTVKVTHILGAPLIEVFPQIMQPSAEFFKRVFDIGFALFALILLGPVYLVLAIIIKMDSRGPILYKQERIGKFGHPFFIYKFRSMYVDAEKFGPALSKDNDPRITKIGRTMRKLRLDELPQFWNVLKGDMSIVGPRPERQFYIDQIVKKAPHYRHLHRVRPGITSWGQVKYGYAENVDEMVERLKFDILYLENMSLSLDLKIIIYTVIVMIEGRGK